MSYLFLQQLAGHTPYVRDKCGIDVANLPMCLRDPCLWQGVQIKHTNTAAIQITSNYKCASWETTRKRHRKIVKHFYRCNCLELQPPKQHIYSPIFTCKTKD